MTVIKTLNLMPLTKKFVAGRPQSLKNVHQSLVCPKGRTVTKERKKERHNGPAKIHSPLLDMIIIQNLRTNRNDEPSHAVNEDVVCITDYGFTEKNIVPKNAKAHNRIAKSLLIESLVDQLCKLLEKDSHKRKKMYEVICDKLFEMNLIDETYQLEELGFLRNYYQQAMASLLRGPGPDLSVNTMLSYLPEWSRYMNEYEELNLIASGGFGKVFKARHKLDQVFYAVKKIFIKFDNYPLLIMDSNEVKTLAMLNHPNIVQYKAAWLEPMLNVSPALPSISNSEHYSSDSGGIVFQESDSSLSFSTDATKGNEEESNLVLCKYKENDRWNNPRTQPQVNGVLFVSMQLCDGTLREWLNKRNASNESIDLLLCLKIMIEATKGLEYIHSCNIVHHDIKPSNIFLSNNLKSVQVGDFGLSCCLQAHTPTVCPLEGGRFGTPLYAAPEKHEKQCDLKSDMFSLGLVFVELVSKFKTEMERVAVLTEIRKGHFPQCVPKEFSRIIQRLVSLNPDDRPSSTQLLQELERLETRPSDFKNCLSVTRTHLITLNGNVRVDSTCQTKETNGCSSNCDAHEILKTRDREIYELRQMLAEKDDEISRLKQYISKIFSETEPRG